MTRMQGMGKDTGHMHVGHFQMGRRTMRLEHKHFNSVGGSMCGIDISTGHMCKCTGGVGTTRCEREQ